MLRSSGLVGPTPGGAEREDMASRTRGRRGRSVVRFQHFQYVTICKVWPASVQLHAPPSPAECETGQSDSVVASYMSKIASECSSLCCLHTSGEKEINIRSGQASPGMVMGAVQDQTGITAVPAFFEGVGDKQAYGNTLCVFRHEHTSAQCVADGQMTVRT